MSPGTALGFFWALGGVYCQLIYTKYSSLICAASAERKGLYRFSVDLGKLALRIVERHGTNADKWYASCCSIIVHAELYFSRSLVMYCSMVSAYDNVHIRSNLPRLEEAIKYANSAGDRCVVRCPTFHVLDKSSLECSQTSQTFIPSRQSCS
jgi:hypothetical protein